MLIVGRPARCIAALVVAVALGVPGSAHAARTISAEDFLASPPAQAFRGGRFPDALKGFQALLRRYPDDILVLRYIGITRLRLGRYQDAVETLERAQALAPGDPAVLFFLGVARFKAGQRAESAADFRRVIALAPDTIYGRRAGQYLRALGQLATEQAPPGPQKAWSLQVQAGVQYDDNIAAAPDSLSGDKDGFRFFERASGSYHAIESGPWRVTVGSGLHLSQHVDAAFDEFDVGRYDAALEARYARRIGEVPVALGVRYGFDLVTLDGSRFSSSHEVLTSVTATPVSDMMSELYHEARFTDFREDGFSPPVSSRDGTSHQFGIREYVFFDRRRHYLWLGYAYELNEAEGVNFESRAHLPSAGVVLSLPWRSRVSLAASYRAENYVEFLGFERRQTDSVKLSAVLTREIIDGLSVSLGYSFTNENSTINVLEYERQIGTLTLIYKF